MRLGGIKEIMRTATGKELRMTVAFRLPISTCQMVLDLAQQRNVKLSTVLRDMVNTGVNQASSDELQEVITHEHGT